MGKLLRRTGRAGKLFALFASTALIALVISGCSTDEEKANTLMGNTGAAVVGEKTVHAAIDGHNADFDTSAQIALSQPVPDIDLAKRFVADSLRFDGPTATPYAELAQRVADLQSANAAIQAAAEKKTQADEALITKLLKQRDEADAKEAAAIKAEGTAFIADAKKGDTLNGYNSWFGLAGLAHYFSHTVIVLLFIGAGLCLIFIGLDFASDFSPAAKIGLTAVESVFALILKGVEAIVPGAFKAAGWVEAEFAHFVPSTSLTPKAS